MSWLQMANESGDRLFALPPELYHVYAHFAQKVANGEHSLEAVTLQAQLYDNCGLWAQAGAHACLVAPAMLHLACCMRYQLCAGLRIAGREYEFLMYSSSQLKEQVAHLLLLYTSCCVRANCNPNCCAFFPISAQKQVRRSRCERSTYCRILWNDLYFT